MERRILLVAMDGDIVQSIQMTLGLARHDVLVADCGLEGIKQARSLSPDLVLVDAILPDMDGSTLIDILRRLPSTGELKTILLRQRQSERASGGEMNTAPLSSSELLAQIALALALCEESRTAQLESEVSGMPAV